MATRNNAISIRLSEHQRQRVKVAANRLDVWESDVLRYAIEISLSKLGPLLDSDSRGLDLLPLFVESGDELLRYFRLDTEQLDKIINDGVEDGTAIVDPRDLALLIRSWDNQPATRLQLSAALGEDFDAETDYRDLKRRFRQYLYEKYLYADQPVSGAQK